MPRLLKRPNPLAFPGTMPGIDPSHPASESLQISVVAVGPTMVDLTLAQKPAPYGTPSNRVDGYLGPTMAAGAAGYTFSGYPSTISQFCTQAGIVSFTAVSGDSAFIADPGLDQGFKLGCNGGVLAITAGFVVAIQSTISLVVNVPYFVAASVNANLALANFVAVRLDTRSIVSSQTSLAGFTPLPPSGFVNIGANTHTAPGDFNGVSAVMSADTFLTLTQLRAWAQDPWSFWYPNNFNIMQSLKPTAGTAATVLMAAQAWSATRRSIEIIGAD